MVRWLSLGGAVAILAFATPAFAQRPARTASAEAFSFCREQEKLGEARACWSVWLQKYRATGTEAEAAYAQAYPATHARLRLTSTPSAALTLDGRALGTTPRESVEVTPGEHRITFVSEGRSEARTITVTAGEARDVDVKFDAPSAAAPRPAGETPRAAASDEAVDFCALPAKRGAKRERVVLFAPSGTGQVNDDGEIRGVDGARLVGEVLQARFAMDRFHNVLAPISGKRGWAEEAALSVAEVRTFTRDAPNEGRPEQETRQLARSLECADFIVVPSITSHQAKWSAPKTTIDGERKPKELSLELGGAVAIFRREGAWFKRIAQLSAIVPGKFEPAPGGPDERQGAVCTEARAGGTPDDVRAALAVQCEVRARAFDLARVLQEDARRVEGWHVFGVVARAESPASITLGRDEGVKVGDAFEVRDARNERIAFFKAVKIGPGGAAGENEPSVLVTRAGEAPEGARLDAYRQLGLVLAPYGSFGLLTYSYGLTRVRSGSVFQDFTLPDVVFGGGATIGYDLSSLVGWTETYARVGVGVLTGHGLNTSATLVPIDLWFEKGFYLARRLSLAAAVGGTVQLASVNILTSMPAFEEELHVASTMIGPAARLGVDVMLHPDWSLKIEAAARVPLNSASYTESDGKTIPPEWLRRDDHFATIAVNLGIAKTF
ncbi:MAG: PEGA domain-containing protein [Labilithrix sp.]|nr:PEGA domain-containing protein [Labilithrix sp.]